MLFTTALYFERNKLYGIVRMTNRLKCCFYLKVRFYIIFWTQCIVLLVSKRLKEFLYFIRRHTVIRLIFAENIKLNALAYCKT